MTNNQEYTSEIKFCVKYLLDHGVNSKNFVDVATKLTPKDQRYDFVKVEDRIDRKFFDELASKLRELWPPGNKSGKYPWRDSVENISKRLQILWNERMKGKTYTIEQCLAAARKYLSQFEDDTTYMVLLKYFILKQEHIVKENGHLTYINKSKLADLLEGEAEELQADLEFEEFMSRLSTEEGELI